jgi:hypothetical protein
MDLINKIPISFQESDLSVSRNFTANSSSANLYAESVSVYSGKLISQIPASYMQSADVQGAPARESDKPAQDYTIYHMNIPILSVYPFGSEFWGDGGPDAPYDRKVTVYYKMIARDNAATGVVYRTWTVTNSPDSDASRYPSDRTNFPLSGTVSDLVDIAISASWEVSDP